MAPITSFAGSIPANYDHYLGPILFEPYALDLVDRLKKDSLKNILELACGTGRVTRHLVKLIADKGRLVAADLNPGMIEIARSKIESNKVQWSTADAQELPFDDNIFDCMVCQFGVMFFPDKEKSFREACRVMKSGGKYIFNTWETVEKNPRIAVIWKVINEVFGKESADFFMKGPHSFHDKNKIEQLLTDAGFKSIRIETVAKTPVYNQPDDLIKGFADGSPLNNFLKEKDKGVQEDFRRRLREALQEQDRTLGNAVPSVALVVEAIK
jgi:ubiquinone/menaquinone biosynthesis C-methylase UbiE